MDQRILKNAVIRDTVQRVQKTGLHRVTAAMHGLPEINLKVALHHLGRTLCEHHMKHSAIRTGINALEFLEKQE